MNKDTNTTIPMLQNEQQVVSDLNMIETKGNPFAIKSDLDVEEDAEFIQDNNISQFNPKGLKRGKLLHFEYLPLGRTFGHYAEEEYRQYSKICVWMFFISFLMYSPMYSNKCAESRYVRDTANALFGLKYKATICNLVLFLICGIIMAFITKIVKDALLIQVISIGIWGILGLHILYTVILYVLLFVNVLNGQQYRHFFMVNYFDVFE